MITDRLILCDFDGTVTARDTNSELARRFAPAAFERLEHKLATREASLRDVLAGQHGEMTAEPELIVGAALEIPVRDGFDEFVAEARRRGERLVVLSSGFRQLIEPMLSHAGHGDIQLVSNELEFSPTGSRITWRQIPICDTCGEECKRHDVSRLRAEFAAAHVTFVGDGFSDRCGAEAADRILALEGGALELDLTGRGVVHETWTDFHDVHRLMWS